MEIISKLKCSHKGQLNYERSTDFVHLYDDLQKCAYPPLGNFSNFYHLGSTDNEKIESTEDYQNNSNDLLVVKNGSMISSSKGFCTMTTLSEEYLQSKMATLEYEALWNKKIKMALKKKMWEFYENDRILDQKMKSALKDFGEQKTFRENCRYKEIRALQNKLAERYEEYQKETVYSKLLGDVKEERDTPISLFTEQEKNILSKN